jgi:hypothetical protein
VHAHLCKLQPESCDASRLCIVVLKALQCPINQRTDETLDTLLAECGPIPFFAQFTRDQQRLMCSLLTLHELSDGEVLFEEGDRADSFYIVYRGKASNKIILSTTVCVAAQKERAVYSVECSSSFDSATFICLLLPSSSFTCSNLARVINQSTKVTRRLIPEDQNVRSHSIEQCMTSPCQSRGPRPRN